MHTWPASSLSTSLGSSNCPLIRRPGTPRYSSTGLLTTLCRSLSSRRATVFQKKNLLFILCQILSDVKRRISYAESNIFLMAFYFNGSSQRTCQLGTTTSLGWIGVNWPELRSTTLQQLTHVTLAKQLPVWWISSLTKGRPSTTFTCWDLVWVLMLPDGLEQVSKSVHCRE